MANLPADDSVFRVLALPPVPRRELPPALKWELQRILPFSVEEAVFDYTVLPPASSPPEPEAGEYSDHGVRQRAAASEEDLRVVAAGAPVATVDGRYRDLAQRGMRPAVLEPEWTILWRLARFFQILGPAGRACAVIDLGHRSTRLLVAGPDGSPVAFHRATAGGSALEEELAAHAGVPVPEFRRRREAEYRDDTAFLGRSTVAAELAGDVNRLFRRVRQELRHIPVDLWAVGGGAAWPALVAALAETIGHPVMVPGSGQAEGYGAVAATVTVDSAEWARQAAVTLARCHPQRVLAAGLALWHGARWAATRPDAWPAPLHAEGTGNSVHSGPGSMEGVGP